MIKLRIKRYQQHQRVRVRHIESRTGNKCEGAISGGFGRLEIRSPLCISLNSGQTQRACAI